MGTSAQLVISTKPGFDLCYKIRIGMNSDGFPDNLRYVMQDIIFD